MITEVSVADFRQNSVELLSEVESCNDTIVVSKDGRPVAALVDAELFARIRRMRDRFEDLSARIAGCPRSLHLGTWVYRMQRMLISY